MKLLVTGAWRHAKEHIAELEDMGHQVVFQQQEAEPLVCSPEEVEGIVCNGLFRYHPVEDFTSLRYIQLTSAGVDRVPLEEIRRRGIRLYNAKNVYSIPMAEYAIGAVLQLYKNFSDFQERQRQRRWEKQRDLAELAGKTVCIVGCGSVGTACAKRFSAFDTKVIGVATHARPMEWFEEVSAIEKLDAVLAISDVAVLALSLTDKTVRLFDAERFRKMKPGSILVNIARGGIVDTAALVEALVTKQIAGAVLDVFEEEPLAENSPLWELENVIVTPHNSFEGEGNGVRLSSLIVENLKKAVL